MNTFFMIGKYSNDSLKEMGVDRTQKSVRLIKELGGEVKSMYALLGGFDFIMIVELPTTEIAMKASLGLNILTGISFSTFPAVSVDDFDRIIGEVG